MSTTSSGAAGAPVGRDVVARDDALARRRAGDHHVGDGERLTDAVEPDGAPADPLGEVGAALRACGWTTMISPAPAWCSAVATPSPISPAPTTSTLRPASEPSRSATISTAAWLIDAVPRPIAVSRAGPLADASAWRNSRSSVERTPPSSLADLPGGAHLAEDLALAEHGRVEPGGHLEQVPGGGLVVLAVEVRVQLVGASAPSSQRKSRMSA